MRGISQHLLKRQYLQARSKLYFASKSPKSFTQGEVREAGRFIWLANLNAKLGILAAEARKEAEEQENATVDS